MKKLCIFSTVIGLFAAGAAGAGTPVSDGDCDSNGQPYSWSDCVELGPWRIQGVVYNDLKGQDNTDAVGAMCRKYGTSKGAEVQIASDFYNRGNNGGKQPVTFVCEPKEVLAGIACKDLPKNDDALDGCTAICQVPGGSKRMIPNPDLESNPRDYVYHTIELPNRVDGIGYKEERRDTDRADCANISYKYEPIVK